MSEKTWGGEPFWGLGYDWDPDWVLTDRQKRAARSPDRAVREGDAGERQGLRRRAEVPAPQPRAARRARLPRADGPEEYGGLGQDHVAFAMTCETIARYGCASTAMCYVMHIGAVNTIMLRPTAGADRQVHPPAEQRQDRDAVLLRPRDRLALLVPDLLRRRALERRLQGPQEGVLDDVGRLRRLLRRADDEPRLHRLRRPVGVRDRRRRTSSRSRRRGTRSACAATSRARSRSRTSRSPASRSSAPSATAPRPTTRRSTRGS